jgi:hypothetical protein
MTVSVFAAAQIVRAYQKTSVDDYAIENISLLMEIRDNAIHFHNVVLQHLDRGPHVGRELKDADSLGESHGGVGMPERVGDALLAVRGEQDPGFPKDPLEAALEGPDRCP